MVTDEMVEKAAEAYWIQVYGRHRKANKWPDDVCGSSQGLFRDGCRAALQAALSAAEPKPDFWDVEEARENKLATVVAPDNGTAAEVLSAVLECAEAWVPEARIIGNVRAGDIARVVRSALSAQVQDVAGWQPVLSVEVKVKPLEWTHEDNGDFISQTVVGWYHVGLPHLTWNLTTPDGDVPSFHDLHEAKAAAQTDYEARIRSALSAQVQDVAGWQPIETAPKDGAEILLYREDCGVMLGRWISCCEFLTDGDPSNDFCPAGDDEAWEEPDWFGADFVSGFRITNDGVPTHWMPLPAAPAKQEG